MNRGKSVRDAIRFIELHLTLDIALEAGYESQQAFTDIFKAMYKQTTNQFRRREAYPGTEKVHRGKSRIYHERGFCCDWNHDDITSNRKYRFFRNSSAFP